MKEKGKINEKWSIKIKGKMKYKDKMKIYFGIQFFTTKEAFHNNLACPISSTPSKHVLTSKQC